MKWGCPLKNVASDAFSFTQKTFCILKFLDYFCNPDSVYRFRFLRFKYTATMKNGIHPGNYRFVVFQDMSNGVAFLSKSTALSRETVKWEDGNEYPLIKLEISNTSHPFYTGKMKLVDTAGRVDKFMNRYKDHIGKKK
jgi:large subunit ribosomal protein L31